jgi:hypothetical protein
MAAAPEALTEPQVLAQAKRRLFPDDGAADTYAVVDTQFAQESWVDRATIDAEVRETLSPFNHVRVGSGYPDLVGVRPLDDDLLGVDRLGGEPPLVAVEAKGYAGGGVDVERGVVQAHDRLGEANVAFVAAPADAVAQTDCALARELNVGVLGVTDGGVETVESPRVVGNRTRTAADAVRFQASAQGVAEQSFGLNHPKNYLAYPLAVAHDRPTDEVLAERVVAAVDAAERGARFLDLVADGPADRSGPELTALGREVVRFALDEYGSVDTALEAFDEWKRSRARFCEVAPRWGQLARRVVYAYPATDLIVRELQTLHDDGTTAPSLVQFVEYLHGLHPSFAVELFLRDEARERALTADGDLRREALLDGDAYHSPTVFQLKAMLFHAGIVGERGAEPHRLDPTGDEWALRHYV